MRQRSTTDMACLDARIVAVFSRKSCGTTTYIHNTTWDKNTPLAFVYDQIGSNTQLWLR